MNVSTPILRLAAFSAVVMAAFTAHATEVSDSIAADTVAAGPQVVSYVPIQAPPPDTTTVVKRGFFQKVLDYFADSNKDLSDKKFDFSILGGPHYSTDTKLGLGLVAAGNYRSRRGDPATSISNVSLYGDVATTGFYLIGIRGNHFFPSDTKLLEYDMFFYSFPTQYWGIGFDNGIDSDRKTDYKLLNVRMSANFLWHVGSFYLGPGAQFTHANATHIVRPELWEGAAANTTTVGVGALFRYDTRDNFTAPTRGWMVSIEQKMCPRFLGNKNAFSYTKLTASTYQRAWKGAIIALQGRLWYNYGNVPWNMLATFGGTNTMRGYYEGRFRDKTEVDATVELRQHIWHRIGMTVWAGAATVAPTFGDMRWHHVLPNFGIGYRWEFKHNTNIRLDYGIGRDSSAFMFSINEAF